MQWTLVHQLNSSVDKMTNLRIRRRLRRLSVAATTSRAPKALRSLDSPATHTVPKDSYRGNTRYRKDATWLRTKLLALPNQIDSVLTNTSLGSGGPTWSATPAQVIASITSGNTFFTSVGGQQAVVAPRPNVQTGPYVRTYADGKWNDNLLALPECR